MSGSIRPAGMGDIGRLAETEVFCYRLFFYPIVRTDEFFFSMLTVRSLEEEYRADPSLAESTLVYDDGGIIKGFVRVRGGEVEKLFVEPAFQNLGIGAALLESAVETMGAYRLLALEKNVSAIRFYARHGFLPTGRRLPLEETDEYLTELARQ